jgi:methionyl-tRNA synthetase
MSKSKLTGIAPTEITDVFGSDAYRFYFLSAIAFGQDGSFSWEDLSARYQAELANGFGNLASRTTAMLERYFEGIVPPAGTYTDADLHIQRTVADAATAADAAIGRFRIDEAISSIWTIVDAQNLYITENEPWALAKDDAQRGRLGTVLYTAAEGLRAIAVLLSPIMPIATQKLWVALGATDTLGRLVDQPIREAGRWGLLPAGASVNALAPLFPRVEQSA